MTDSNPCDQLAFKQLAAIYAEQIRPVAFWIGAGLSQPAGFPGWRQLRGALDAALVEKIRLAEPAFAEKLRRYKAVIDVTSNPWEAFDLYRGENVLGTRFETVISLTLRQNKKGTPLPKCYDLLAKLHLRGIVTLNLDRLAESAMRKIRGDDFHPILGTEMSAKYRYFASRTPYLLQLHGVVDEPDTWILTKTALEHLRHTTAYNQFLRSLFTEKTIIFLGVSVDDVATYGIIESLEADQIPASQHFWITDRNDEQTDAFCSRIGIETILYNSSAGHEQQLITLLETLANYRSYDSDIIASTPIMPPGRITTSTFPEPAAVSVLPPERIRLYLNEHIKSTLEQNANSDNYAKFLTRYDFAIHQAWYVALGQDFLGYKLTEQIGSGAFGTVYSATTAHSSGPVAVKILHERIRTDPQKVAAFRRGINSMKILAQQHVEGAVKIIAAFEIPACIIMEYIPGVNLEKAVKSNRLDPYFGGILVAERIAKIVDMTHKLREHVLHRDLRPQNVMLKDFFVDKSAVATFEVVILDFDLSWHEGSLIDTPTPEGDMVRGYLAPEQLVTIGQRLTRHAAVDSYGLAMTLYFIFNKSDPYPNLPRFADWDQLLLAGLPGSSRLQWSSARRRIAKLIFAGTRVEQSDRISMKELGDGLHELREALANPNGVTNVEMWAEEIMCRVFPDYEPSRLTDKDECRLTLKQGVTITLEGEPLRGTVVLAIDRMDTGEAARGSIGKYWPEATTKAKGTLASSGWQLEETSGYSSRAIRIKAAISVDVLQQSANKAIGGLTRAAEMVSFS